MLYWTARSGTTSGTLFPSWQDQQDTTGRPPKFVLLIAATIAIIRRAVALRGVSSAYLAQSAAALPHVAILAIETGGGRKESHGLHELVDRNAAQHPDVLEDVFGHRRSARPPAAPCLGARRASGSSAARHRRHHNDQCREHQLHRSLLA